MYFINPNLRNVWNNVLKKMWLLFYALKRESWHIMLFSSIITLLLSQRVVPYWTEVSLAITTENLGFNFWDSRKVQGRTSTDQHEGYCYVWPHRAEPPTLSGCVVVPPSATVWGGPGALSEATVETEPLSECKVRRSDGCASGVSPF